MRYHCSICVQLVPVISCNLFVFKKVNFELGKNEKRERQNAK